MNGEKLTDISLMYFGKYYGKQMADVPADYLLFIYENYKLATDLREYIQENIDVLKSEVKGRKK